MPSSNKFADVANCVLLSLAILCGVYCLFIVGAIYFQSDGVGFAIIDYMVAAEGEVPDPSLSPGYYLRWVIGLSLLGAAFSILGCIGSCDCLEKEVRQPFLSVFFCSMLALSVFFMIVYTSALEFNADMVPILDRQVKLITDATVLPVFSARLGCPLTGPTSLPGQLSAAELTGCPGPTCQHPCGEDCQERTELIQKMANRTADGPDSCAFLVALNHDHVYNLVGVGKCQVTPEASGAPGLAPAPAPAPTLAPSYAVNAPSLNNCKDACTTWTACAGVSYDASASSCHLVSSSDPDAAGTDYTLVPGSATQIITPIFAADGSAAFECHAKSMPVILESMIQRNLAFSYLMIIGAVVVLVSALLSAVITFTVATKMQGKKGIHMICFRMYCGCCLTPSDKVRVADNTEAGESETDRLTGK